MGLGGSSSHLSDLLVKVTVAKCLQLAALQLVVDSPSISKKRFVWNLYDTEIHVQCMCQLLYHAL